MSDVIGVRFAGGPLDGQTWQMQRMMLDEEIRVPSSGPLGERVPYHRAENLVHSETGTWVRYDHGPLPRGEGMLYGGDSCPVCGAELDYEDDTEDVWLIHPDPPCGWIPSGYPSTRRGAEDGRAPLPREIDTRPHARHVINDAIEDWRNQSDEDMPAWMYNPDTVKELAQFIRDRLRGSGKLADP